MRLFVAIKTNAAINMAVGSCAGSLSLFGNGSFCSKDMYHITLAFIGERESAGTAVRALEKTEFRPFEIHTGKLINFKNTYCVSIEENRSLSRLNEEVVRALSEEGIDTEKRTFVPHITVARRFVKRAEPLVFVPSASMTVDEIVLAESINGKYKALYRKKANPTS